jgi:hypothetical protein
MVGNQNTVSISLRLDSTKHECFGFDLFGKERVEQSHHFNKETLVGFKRKLTSKMLVAVFKKTASTELLLFQDLNLGQWLGWATASRHNGNISRLYWKMGPMTTS